MSRPITIDSEWRNFSELAIDPSATAAERMDLRRAFYAGAGAMYNALAMAEGDHGISQLHDEVAEYIGSLLSGAA